MPYIVVNHTRGSNEEFHTDLHIWPSHMTSTYMYDLHIHVWPSHMTFTWLPHRTFTHSQVYMYVLWPSHILEYILWPSHMTFTHSQVRTGTLCTRIWRELHSCGLLALLHFLLVCISITSSLQKISLIDNYSYIFIFYLLFKFVKDLFMYMYIDIYIIS